ncbi:putative DNA-directed RNA polymerase [Daphnia magna]|uniref:Putative DNA-directed RNA polymerase n=1 Tax=Daphnia magna TaxID=35525 RepID=A0A162QIW2_9CRUS|nr:putative DNA-directed RNA polymerase [Daphnia magna]
MYHVRQYLKEPVPRVTIKGFPTISQAVINIDDTSYSNDYGYD